MVEFHHSPIVSWRCQTSHPGPEPSRPVPTLVFQIKHQAGGSVVSNPSAAGSNERRRIGCLESLVIGSSPPLKRWWGGAAADAWKHLRGSCISPFCISSCDQQNTVPWKEESFIRGTAFDAAKNIRESFLILFQLKSFLKR